MTSDPIRDSSKMDATMSSYQGLNVLVGIYEGPEEESTGIEAPSDRNRCFVKVHSFVVMLKPSHHHFIL